MRVQRLMCLAFSGCAAGYAGGAGAVLTHYYSFDDVDIVGSSGAADGVGSANALPTGALGGANITTGQPGILGQAYRFVRDDTGSAGNNTTPGDASDFENTLRLAAGSVPAGNAPRTIALWFNFGGGAGQNKLFGYGSPNTDNDGTTGEALDIGLEGGGIRLRNFNGNITYGSGLDFAPGGADAGWHHLALRVNPGASTFADIELFLDGTPLAPADAGDADLNDTLAIADSAFGIGNIGYDHFLLNGFTGLIDELRIYDHAVSNAEIVQLALPPGVVPGDTDNDGDIDGSDMLNALSGYTGPGGTGATPATGDTDADGDVDDTDIGLMMTNYTGPLAPPAAVPEPVSVLWLGSGGLLFSGRRRRQATA
ncbi:MAG: LamG-like jellyroll fold domain-containing protein [Phycisphaeraceae bacterium]